MGILDGLRVIDISRAMAGPVVAMVLADDGADVVRIEPPSGDPYRDDPSYRVWNRGKRRITLDLHDEGGLAALRDLASQADVVIDTFRPGVLERLGLDHASLSVANPGLITCSITGYGRDNKHSDRPGFDALVAARGGAQWDQRGYFGSRYDHVAGRTRAASEYEYDPEVEQTGCREGPIFLGVPWPSIGAALLGLVGVSAALYVRERTGRGQRVETSLLQGVMLDKVAGWQHVDHPDCPGYALGSSDRRGPKGLHQCGDGLWLHQWTYVGGEFVKAAAQAVAEGRDPKDLAAPGMHRRPASERRPDFLREIVRDWPAVAAAYRTLPREAWLKIFADVGVAAQPVLSAEDGLLDEALLHEGTVTELEDPRHGRIRQVGHVYAFEKTVGGPIERPVDDQGAALTEVLAGWAPRVAAEPAKAPLPGSPLEGIVVLDFGAAVAGPMGPQMLADLGATVLKIGQKTENLNAGIHVGAARGKKSAAINLKDPRGLAIVRKLIERCDVIHHNMRTGVAERLGIGYEDARVLNPSIIYCHTRGYEKDGPRTHLPGNDQMGNALLGTEYEMGGTHWGTPPIWPVNAFGDIGTGVLSAAAVMQALRHRERTGEGQFLSTSILVACAFFNSYTFAYAGGGGPPRPRMDARQLGYSALHRLYETADGWLCLVVRDERDWRELVAATESTALADDPRFASAESRQAHDAQLAAALEPLFCARTAASWFADLDARDVPCEIASHSFPRETLSDPEFIARGWVTSFEHPYLGLVRHPGNLIDFSETPGTGYGRTPVTGQDTREVLELAGLDAPEIAALAAEDVVTITETG